MENIKKIIIKIVSEFMAGGKTLPPIIEKYMPEIEDICRTCHRSSCDCYETYQESKE